VEKVVQIDLELLEAGQSGDSFSTPRIVSSQQCRTLATSRRKGVKRLDSLQFFFHFCASTP